MFSLDACLKASVEISFTILLSSKLVACCCTAEAGTLASGIEPEVKLLAFRFVKSTAGTLSKCVDLTSPFHLLNLLFFYFYS